MPLGITAPTYPPTRISPRNVGNSKLLSSAFPETLLKSSGTPMIST